MNLDEYKQAVIALLRSGKATDKHWNDVAQAVLYCSESDYCDTESIDATIFGRCPECDEVLYEGDCECQTVIREAEEEL